MSNMQSNDYLEVVGLCVKATLRDSCTTWKIWRFLSCHNCLPQF